MFTIGAARCVTKVSFPEFDVLRKRYYKIYDIRELPLSFTSLWHKVHIKFQ
jgi:hypothetical protein